MRCVYLCIGAALASIAISAPAQAACDFRYDSKWAEVAASAQANLRAQGLKSLSSKLESALGDKSSATATVDARYAVAGAGGLAEEAYSETMSAFLCKLREKWAADPAKLAVIDDAEKNIRLELSRYFDVGLYTGENAFAAREAVRSELRNMTVPAAPLKIADVDPFLPKPNFDLVKITQFTGTVDVANVAEVGTCLGLVRRSIRQVDGNVLSGLGLIRPMVVKWLAGDSASARLDLWLFASSRMSAQVIKSVSSSETVTVTPPFLACVKKAAEAANAAQNGPPEAKLAEPTSGFARLEFVEDLQSSPTGPA